MRRPTSPRVGQRTESTYRKFMRKLKVPIGSHGNADELEQAFYEALQTGDLNKLMACWADEDDIVCVHPGGGRLVGAPAIRASFEALFNNGRIQAHAERVRRVESLTASIHSVLERVQVQTPQGDATERTPATR